MYKLCVFDLDGTLVDTIGDLTASLNAALTECGFPRLEARDVSAIVGYSAVYMCQKAVPPESMDAWEGVYRAFQAHYAVHLCDRSRPYAGVMPMLQRLRQAGVTLAVATNKPHAHAVKLLAQLFPRDTFSIILGRMEKFEIKPAPDALRFVMDHCNAAEADTVYVGDSEVDIAFAKNAGVPCISVSWGLRTRSALIESGAAQIADDPLEVAEMVIAGYLAGVSQKR